MHVAAAVATAAGLWSGMEAAPLDGERTWSGARMAASRGYVRQLDATALLDQLAGSGFGGEAVTVSRSAVGEALGIVPVDAQFQAARGGRAKRAGQRWAQPSSRRRSPLSHRRRRSSVVRIIRDVLLVCRKSTAGSPAAWVPEVLRRAQARIGESSTRFLFGEDSRYQVVLGGLATGGPTRVTPTSSIRRPGECWPARTGSEIPPVGAPALWSDAVRTTAVLVDGGYPTDGILTPTQGASRLVIDDARRVATVPGTAAFPRSGSGARSNRSVRSTSTIPIRQCRYTGRLTPS